MSWTALTPDQRGVVRPLFAHHRPSFLIDAVLEGHLGEAWVDRQADPHVAWLEFADIIVLGGDADCSAAAEAILRLPVDKAILPAPDPWAERTEQELGDRVVRIERFAFTDEALDVEHLGVLAANLPAGFSVARIDLDLARMIVEDPTLITEDHVANFASPEDFVQRGIGFCVLHDGRIVAGASSYAVCDAGIEIQVNTHPDHRGKGLATAVSAVLIRWCLEHGQAAHWDAGNDVSVRLATRLGYTLQAPYTAQVRIA